ncbi:hypothetical protein FH972_025313 [Carpinus fangiana]|uniref:Uncharacterized protein n=1 Tax=Carpinus fangiana TaxID=176857 RepID=A0A5N6L0N6_9ROSI|nr:hypothetical protein FH972_025313 [Carpinus fangiana]
MHETVERESVQGLLLQRGECAMQAAAMSIPHVWALSMPCRINVWRPAHHVTGPQTDVEIRQEKSKWKESPKIYVAVARSGVLCESAMHYVVGYDCTGASCKVYGYVENDGDDDDDDDDDGKKVAPAA